MFGFKKNKEVAFCAASFVYLGKTSCIYRKDALSLSFKCIRNVNNEKFQDRILADAHICSVFSI